ncbi:LysR family transcriptional regulator [Streptomyces sp. NPDC055013]
MERRQLEYCIAIVEHGGFTTAANALHVAQPSLSHAIRTLERECGGKRFHRLAQGVTTPCSTSTRSSAPDSRNPAARPTAW